MKKKVLLILVDGLKGSTVATCKNEFSQTLLAKSSANLTSRTVMPSVTLPCHMSLFHSVPSERHGVLTNTYTPQVRPVKSLFNLLAENEKTSMMFYNWEQLRDLSRPGALCFSMLAQCDVEGKGEVKLAKECVERIKEDSPDFIFFYIGSTDIAGHDFGWETDGYEQAVERAFCRIEELYNVAKDDYTIIVTADHGGHNRGHGEDIDEDMIIPIMIIGEDFGADIKLPEDSNIMDIAPTITKIFGINKDKDWEGKPLF